MQFKYYQYLAHLCTEGGIGHAVVSPGSRSAPLTVAFAREKGIKKHIVADERSAGYIALGISQSCKSPVILLCTSGTAAVNYAPAVVEAFYQHVPLIVITADRPPEWIDQGDGQTIHQENLYGNHVKSFCNLFAEIGSDGSEKIVLEKFVHELNKAIVPVPGPIHINVPIHEPFYGDIPGIKGRKIEHHIPDVSVPHKKNQPISNIPSLPAKKILMIAGQLQPDSELYHALEKFSTCTNIVVIVESHSNLHLLKNGIRHHDLIFRGYNENDYNNLKPDIIITFGEAIISKALKSVVRRWKVDNHWHIQEGGEVADVFQSVNTTIDFAPSQFFKKVQVESSDINYRSIWDKAEHHADAIMLRQNFACLDEFVVTKNVLKNLPEHSVLHVGNSMPIRWVNMIGISNDISVYCNRGTSGIDGVMSTAMGHAMTNESLHTVLIGDMSFFYDRNAFWHNEIPKNLRIILLNNHGGGIFKLIDGPKQLPECDEYFVTKHSLSGKNIAADFNLSYTFVDSMEQFRKELTLFFDPDYQSKLMEIEISIDDNVKVFKQLTVG